MDAEGVQAEGVQADETRAAADIAPPVAVRRLPTCDDGPEVRLLDACASGIDEQQLREVSRRWQERSGAPFRSRSYCHPYALIAWHSCEVGVDIERVQRCEPAFARSICTPEEIARDWSAVEDPDTHFISMWSSKEAVAKALGDALSYDPRRLPAPLLWPEGRAGAWRAVGLEPAPGHVAWVCWRGG